MASAIHVRLTEEETLRFVPLPRLQFFYYKNAESVFLCLKRFSSLSLSSEGILVLIPVVRKLATLPEKSERNSLSQNYVAPFFFLVVTYMRLIHLVETRL